MTKDVIGRLLAHMRWADTRAREALRDSPGALVERALELYDHVLGAEHIWLVRLRGEAATLAVWPRLTVREAERVANETHAGFEAYLAGVDEAGLAREVTYRNSAGDEFRTRVDDILTHVAMHGSYHRGQVAMLIRDGGGTPSPTDYIAFIRGSPAATQGRK